MIIVYLIIIAVVAIFSYKYIFVDQDIARTKSNKHFKRKIIYAIWKKKFKANMADIEYHWNKDHPKHKRQNIVVKGALKRFEKAWVE